MKLVEVFSINKISALNAQFRPCISLLFDCPVRIFALNPLVVYLKMCICRNNNKRIIASIQYFDARITMCV